MRKVITAVLLAAAVSIAVPVEAALIGTLSRTSPNPQSFDLSVDFLPMTGSVLGSATGVLAPVDLLLAPGNLSTSGCMAADFAGFTAGAIALIQRGACDFALKALNAQAAGAVGVLIFNQGDTAGRFDVFPGNVASASGLGIPVMGLSYPLGVELALGAFPILMHMSVTESTAPVSTPEPASATLLVLGLASLAARRLRAL